MQDLTHKTSLIAGPVNELALGVARSLREAGSRILFATAERPSAADEKAAGSLDAVIHTVDLDDPGVLAAQIESLPPFEVAVFNPGWFEAGEFMDTTAAAWDEALHQNYEQMVYAAQAAARAMIRRGGGGRLIFLSPAAGLMPFLYTSVAGTSLSALTVIARMAAVDLGAHGITSNVVAHGWLDADRARPYLHAKGRAFVETGIPAGRIGGVEDVGALCRFLASGAAQYVTGAIIPVDGGYTITRAPGTSPYPQMP